tara:strand:- start:1000 stop:1194 length:195 start_codon:yes stop_codon:yes gene_type:complete
MKNYLILGLSLFCFLLGVQELLPFCGLICRWFDQDAMPLGIIISFIISIIGIFHLWKNNFFTKN